MNAKLFLVAVSSVLLFFSEAHAQDRLQPHRLIIAKIDESQRVVLHGNTRPEAAAANDKGRVPDNFPMNHMQLLLRRPADREQALESYLGTLTEGNSPNFHHWLTATEIGSRYGQAPQDTRKIVKWLASHGFRIGVMYPGGVVIDFSGTAGQVRSAFHTEIHHLLVNGEAHFANMNDPQIPSALTTAVIGTASFHDFRPKTAFTASPPYTYTGKCKISNNTCYAVTPADLWTIYNFAPLFPNIAGHHQVIAAVEDSDVNSLDDWRVFRKKFGLAAYHGTVGQIHPPPPTGLQNCDDPGVSDSNHEAEAIIDAEWASAAAPAATIALESCATAGNSTWGGLIAIQNLIYSASPPRIISLSFTECEPALGYQTGEYAYFYAFQTAAAEGVSVFVSNGDSGGAGCDDPSNAAATQGISANGYAVSPYDVAVGGTDFGDTYANENGKYWTTNSTTGGSALSYIPEISWNDSCASKLLATFVTSNPDEVSYGAHGFCNTSAGSRYRKIVAGAGGGSPFWVQPSWQTKFAGALIGERELPDVSLFSGDSVWSHYYLYCDSYDRPCSGAPEKWSHGGGTSFAAPIWAGIQALINEKAGERQGNPNPTLYGMAAKQYGMSGDPNCNSTNGNEVSPSCVFYDVTQGDDDVDCSGTNSCYLPSGTYGVLSTSNGAYQPAFGTTIGWDSATGIGTPNVANLVNTWAPAQPLSVRFKLHDVKFADGGTATGSITFDLAANEITSVDITTTPGSSQVFNQKAFYTSCTTVVDGNGGCDYAMYGNPYGSASSIWLGGNPQGYVLILLFFGSFTPTSTMTIITGGDSRETVSDFYYNNAIVSGTISPEN